MSGQSAKVLRALFSSMVTYHSTIPAKISFVQKFDSEGVDQSPVWKRPY